MAFIVPPVSEAPAIMHVNFCDDSASVSKATTTIQPTKILGIPDFLPNGVKRLRSSLDANIATSNNKLLEASGFANIDKNNLQHIFNSHTLREHFRSRFQSIVRLAVTDILKPIKTCGQSISQLQKETDELQRRLSKLEVSSNKIKALVLESPALAKSAMPALPEVTSPLQQQSEPLTTHATLYNQPSIYQPSGPPVYGNAALPTTSNNNRFHSPSPLKPSWETAPGGNNNYNTIDLTVDSMLPQSNHMPGNIQPNPQFNNPGFPYSHPRHRTPNFSRLYRPRQPHQQRSLPPPTLPLKSPNIYPEAAVTFMNVLAHQALKESVPLPVAPLAPWIQPVLPLDVLGRPTVLRVQPPLQLVISSADEGICLRWELGPTTFEFEFATSYELFSYASSDVAHLPVLTHKVWQKVGDVSALPLPMACTLTSIMSNNIYYFVVRSVDRYQRVSDWSNIVNAHVN